MNEFRGKSAGTTRRSIDVTKEGGLFFCPETLMLTVTEVDDAESVISLATTTKLYVMGDRGFLTIRLPESRSR